MPIKWENALSKAPGLKWKDKWRLKSNLNITSLYKLKTVLDWLHIRYCLVKPYVETENYPLVDSRELLPSFESDLYEYKDLPGFSLVVLDRPINYFQEIFQFDLLHSIADTLDRGLDKSCPLENTILCQNLRTFQSRLPKMSQDTFEDEFKSDDITDLDNYASLLPYILQLERGHVMAKDMHGLFYLAGIWGSFPSDLDNELKRFGLKHGKFEVGNNAKYERNRNFVYQFLMELYGFPIASERRTSGALFARRLFRMGESFLIRVMGQSDRTITTLYSHPKAKYYPRIEKIALVSVDKNQTETIDILKDGGYFVDSRKRVVILRVIYKQHKYNPNNVRQDRALSVDEQEIIHPFTGQVLSTLNIIKDTYSMYLVLNDIVRGEYTGRIRYKRTELIENTETHENRLKFLYSWISKHQRRIIGYSDEFFANVVKVMDNYLLNPDNFEIFNNLYELYQEVWSRYSYIQQARKVKTLEDLVSLEYRGEKLNYLQMLKQISSVLQDLKFEIVNYFDPLVEQIIALGDQVLNNSYIHRKYIQPPEDQLTDYGREVRKYFGRLVSLIDEFTSIRKSHTEKDRRHLSYFAA